MCLAGLTGVMKSHRLRAASLFIQILIKTSKLCMFGGYKMLRDASTSQIISVSSPHTLTEVESPFIGTNINFFQDWGGSYKYPRVPDCCGEIRRRQTMHFPNSLFWENSDGNKWQLLMNRNIRRSDKFLLHQKWILKMIHHSTAN